MKIMYLAPFVLVTACGSPKADLVTQCMFEVSPPGAYSGTGSGDTATVVPAEGGTQAGADALNDCIRRRAAA